MDKEKLIESVNKAFHRIWYSIMFQQPEKGKDYRKLSFVEMYLLYIAENHPEYILGDIRKELKIPQTTLSSSVAKLERLGYLNRVINPRDMRSFSLQISEKGETLRGIHKKHDREIASAFLDALNEKEQEVFARLFEKIAISFSKEK